MKTWHKMVIGIAISALCIWLSMKDVDPAQVWRSLRAANYGGFVAVMGVTIAGFWVRAVRWRYFIQVDRRVSTDSLFSATMIGFMANSVLPLRLGEFVRPWALARREKLSKSTLLGTVVVERAIDMLTLLTIFGVTQIVKPIGETTDAGRLVQWGARVLIAGCAGLTVFVVALERSPNLARRFTILLTGFLPGRMRDKAGRALDHFLRGLGLFRDIGRLTIVLALSFAMFLTFALALAIGMWSLGIDVPWYGGLFMLVITAIGIMVPAAPGYIGTLNYACVVGLALFGVGKDEAVPFGWFYWFSQWLPITVVGLVYLNREGLSLRSLGQAHSEGP